MPSSAFLTHRAIRTPALLIYLFLVASLPLGLLADSQLEIIRVAPDSVTLAWTNRTDQLERADLLAGPDSWSTVAEPPTEVEGRMVLTVQATQAAAYFRLRKAPGSLPPDPATIAPPLPTTQPTAFANATAFLFTGSDPVQTGVTPGAIVAERACVARGSVRDLAGSPLPGVTVSVLDHPELGQTLSRTDGRFDLALNGGGPVVIKLAKTGLLPVQRQIQSRWQDYVAVPEVVMTSLDPVVTSVTLGAGAPVQVARGSVQLDTDGARQATVVLPAGTSAALVLPDGSTLAADTLHVRATEYTVGTNGPAAMPATLPANVGYTYCVEMSADEAIQAGAREVRFDRPLAFYVENFIGFPVGSAVPTGYYDRQRAMWVPSANGRVVRITGIAGGLAGLDADGDGSADSPENLDALGVTDEERGRLALLYASGTELWRVPITHFTPWDHNWPYGLPAGAIRPPPPLPPLKPSSEIPKPTKKCASLIEVQNQLLIETVPVDGTPFSLHYRSARAPGREDLRTLDVTIAGAQIPETVKRVELKIEVAGRTYATTFPRQPNQRQGFAWDRFDGYGRAVTGLQPATVRVGYVYGAVYQTPAEQNASFGLFAGTPFNIGRGELEITLWNESATQLEGFPAGAAGLGSWTLSVHHTYHPATQALHLGDGSRRSASVAGQMVLSTVEGVGAGAMAVGADGSLYIANTIKDANNRDAPLVRRVGTDGVISRYAGSGQRYGGEDEGPASNARFDSLNALALGPDGSLFIADIYIIHRVSPDGIVSTVIGDHTDGFSPDGNLAAQGKVGQVNFLAVASDGSLYFDDYKRDSNVLLIRRIGPDGLLRTVAGAGSVSGGVGPGGSPVPASSALFGNGSPQFGEGGAMGPDDTLYLMASARLQRLDPDGMLRLVSGMFGDTRGSTGDGGPAIDATLTQVRALAVGRDGSLFVSCWKSSGSTLDDYRVRQVGTDGIIRTVAGNGSLGFPQDGPATQACGYPGDLAAGPDGSVFISNRPYGVVKRLSHLGIRQEADELWVPAEDGAEVYVFNASGRHLRTLNGLTGGTRFQFTYGETGLLASLQDAAGNRTTILRNPAGRATAIVAPHGQRTELALNAEGLLAQITRPGGASIPFAYDAGGLLTTRTDAGTNVHTYTYDSLGRLVLDQGPDGGFQRLTRTESDTNVTVVVSTPTGTTNRYTIENLAAGGQRRTRIDPAQLKWELTEGTDGSFVHQAPDGMVIKAVEGPDPIWGMDAPVLQFVTLATPGKLTNTITSLARVGFVNTSTNYPLGFTSLTHIVTFNGQGFTNTFGTISRVLTQATPLGRKLISTLTPAGDLARMAPAGLHPTEWHYDAEGRPSEAIVGDGNADRRWTFHYDAAGQVNRWVYPDGKAVDTTYDTDGRATNRVYPGGRTVEYTYDTAGNATSVKPPGRPAHGFTYSGTDLTTAYLPPGAPEVHFAHDLDGRLSRLTRGDGQVLAFDYGASDCRCGRLLSVTEALGVTAYTYSPLTGHLTSILTPEGAANRYDYDGALMTQETWSGDVTGRVARVYNTDFRVASRTVNGVAPITYLRDKDGLLTQSGDLALTRDRNHGLVTATALQNVSDQRRYNGFGEMEEYTATQGASPLLRFTWTRDLLGQITNRTETIEGVTATYVYAYDDAGRLAEVRKDGVIVEAYTYDDNGNRLSATGNLAATAQYDERDALATLVEGASQATFTYNGHLELTERVAGDQTTRYAYNALGHLRQATLPDGTEIRYVLDGRNRRIGKRVNGALVQGFLYQDQLRPIAELDAANAVVSRFLYATQPHVPDYLIRGGTAYRLLTDQVGSVRMVVNAGTGEVVQRLAYDAWGRVLEDTNPGFQPFGFAGGLYDRDTKLVHFGMREYDPGTGRWISRDPLLFGGGQMNFFAYAGHDPVNRIDPAGLVSVEATGFAVIGGGVKISVDAEGFSICGEIGLGLGVGVAVDPAESIDGDSTSIIGEISAEKGPLGGSVKGELDDCGRASVEGKACLGPFCAKAKKTFGKDGVEKGGEVAGSDLLDHVTDMLKQAIKGANTKLQAKVAARQCVQHKW